MFLPLDKVVLAVKQRDLEGNSSLLSHNSFSVLQDDDIVSKALEIGIDISSLPMKIVHMLKDLESARENLARKNANHATSTCIPAQSPVSVHNINNNTQFVGSPLSVDDSREDEVEFTPVVSRKNKKSLKKNSSGAKSNQGVPLCGTKSLKKVNTDHPERTRMSPREGVIRLKCIYNF
jgi:hypothetical protein